MTPERTSPVLKKFYETLLTKSRNFLVTAENFVFPSMLKPENNKTNSVTDESALHEHITEAGDALTDHFHLKNLLRLKVWLAGLTGLKLMIASLFTHLPAVVKGFLLFLVALENIFIKGGVFISLMGAGTQYGLVADMPAICINQQVYESCMGTE